MNHEEENNNQAPTVATPPPFRPGEDAAEAQQSAASPSMADRIAAMALDEETTIRLQQLTQGIDESSISPELLTTLAQGITHDTDVDNADAAGYLRGRNENIEAVMHPQPQADEQLPQSTPVFPRYTRRSIWER